MEFTVGRAVKFRSLKRFVTLEIGSQRIRKFDMRPMPEVSDLPYHLPTDTLGQLRVLAKLLGVPPYIAEQSGEAGVEAMTATILYRHLDHRQRIQAMEKIKSLPDRALVSKLVKVTLDTTFVNPQWGLWSLTNEELAEDIRFHEAIARVGAITGATLSFSSGKDVLSEILRNDRLGPKGITLLVIGVAFAGNETAKNASMEELQRRSQVKSSPYYQ